MQIKQRQMKKEGYSKMFWFTLAAIVINVGVCVLELNWLAAVAWVCSALYCWIAEENRQHAKDCFNWGQDCFEWGKKIQEETKQAIKN